MENLTNVTALQIANNAVLAIAISWVIWQFWSVWRSTRQGGGIFPILIPTWFLFVAAIVGVELLHVSPLHLIWLFVVCLVIGLVAMTVPLVQDLAIGVLGLLLLTRSSQSSIESTPSKFSDIEPQFKSSNKKPKETKGFGN